MTITRNVIDDLLPAYFSGEASADTRRLVDEYFQQHPEVEVETRRAAVTLQSIAREGLVAPEAQREIDALKRAKRLLRIQAILLAVASTLSLNVISLGFSFELSGSQVRVHWLAYPGQKVMVAILAVLAIASWAIYYRIRGRVRARVLG